LRSFVGAVNTIKLYTLKSGAAAEAIKNLTEKLRLFFTRLPVLSLSKTGDALLLNGEKIDIAEMASFRGIADSFLKHLEDVGLESLTFLNTVTLNQMNTLFGAFGSICGGAVSVDHWQRIARERELTGILFNQHLYEIEVVQNLNGHPADGSEVPPTFSPPEDPRLSQEQFDELADNFAGYLEEMFLIDDQDGIAHMIGKLLTGLENRVTPIRKSVLGTCGEALEKLDLAFQHDYIKLLADPLLSAFNKEEEPKIISETAAVLSRLVGHLILLADYPLASRILLNLRKRYQKFKAAKDPQAIMLASVMRKSLEPRTHRLLVADLRSDDPSRQQLAAQLLEGLGAVVAPLLVDTIKQEEDYRVRQTAALLLRKAGAKAIEGLKHQLASGIGAEERRRILDIIDTLTRDVRSEFALAVADENPHVREAAYRLAERIKDKKTVEILLDFVKSHNGPQAIGAIECLGRLGSEDVEETLIELLNSSRDEQLRIACCRALGQLGKPGGIETLVGVLLPRRKFLFFLERQSARLRAEAALALGQITHPMAAKNFARFINDDDPTVRKLARRALEADASSALSQRQKSAETSAH